MYARSTRMRLLASTVFATVAVVGNATAQTSSDASKSMSPPVNSATTANQSPSVAAPTSTPSTDAPVSQQSPATAPSFGPPPQGPIETPAPAGAPSGSAVAEVVVTGSRIRSPNLTSDSPLTVVNQQEVRLEGAQNIENLLNSLPSVTADQSSNVSNGSQGIATVNLRDLNANRTLVLVDGKRLMPGDPRNPVADLNNIPSALVDRVDVVTGGASAVYGADAVAGVVNFILKKNFQGVEIDNQYGFDEHDNNNPVRALQGNQGTHGDFPLAPGNILQSLSEDVTLLMGVNAPDGKGNITAYAGYRHLDAITQDKYDASACTIFATNVKNPDSYIYDGHRCFGSSNSAYGRFNVVSPNAGAVTKTLHDNPDGTPTFTTAAVPGYNFAPVNYFQRPEDRYTGGFSAHYKVNDSLEVYSDLMFADDHTAAQIAQSGAFAGVGSNGTSYYQINCNNPLLSATQASQLCGTGAGTSALVDTQIGLRFVNAAPRVDNLRHTNYKIDIGARGDIAPGWAYDAYLQYGSTIYSEEYLNDASVSRIQNGLLVNPDGTCMTGTGSGCVPLNLFQFGGLSKAALAYVDADGFEKGQTQEQIASASITGDLGQYGVKSPFASDGLGVALGTEYRREQLDLETDQEFTTGDLSGQGGPTIGDSGSFDVYELFGELRIPIAQNMPFAKSISLDTGYRFSDYSTAGVTNTYKLEGEWAITSDVRLRGGYNRAVRAPNVVELFQPSQTGDVGANDPCAGVTSVAGYSAGCINSFTNVAKKLGLTPQEAAAELLNIQQCPAAQCNQLASGNTALTPEKADTYTAGIVFTPTYTYLRGFTGSIDYYNIYIQNVISAPTAQAILNECITLNVSSACNLIDRDPTSGILYGNQGYVQGQTINGGFQRTQGVDFTANYTFRPTMWGLPDFGTVSLAFLGTYTGELRTQPITGGLSYDCAGLFGPTCGVPLPKWRSKVRLSYVVPKYPVTFSVDWRHVGAVTLDANKANPLLADLPSGISDTADNHIHPFDYFDLSMLWKLKDNLTFRAGVSNVFDKDPPVLDATLLPASATIAGNGNTYPGVYDSLGRSLFVGLTADF